MFAYRNGLQFLRWGQGEGTIGKQLAHIIGFSVYCVVLCVHLRFIFLYSFFFFSVGIFVLVVLFGNKNTLKRFLLL